MVWGKREVRVLLKIPRGDIDGVGEVINSWGKPKTGSKGCPRTFCFCGFLPSFLFFCNQPGPQVVASGRREQSGWVWFEFRIRE